MSAPSTPAAAPAGASPLSAGRGSEARHLQIVAHPDDDLYFLNPDLMQAVQRGEELLSVCLTVGEADGKNMGSGHPDFADAEIDFAGYSAARQNGLRAAYAYMATGDRHSAWKHEPVELGAAGELGCGTLSTLLAFPTVRLLFLNIWQHGTHSGVPDAGHLEALWEGDAEFVATLAPTGSLMPRTGTIGREQLIGLLTEVLRQYEPTVVRTLDADPDVQRHDAKNRQHADSGNYSEHRDHFATALFSWAAIQAYQAEPGHPAAAVESYRGYYNERWPHNLSATAFRTKAGILAVYGWADGHECALPDGCGDRKVLSWAPSTGWGQSTTQRYANSTTWLHPGPDGTLNAFAVLGGQAHHWRQSTDGTWAAPTVLPGEDGLPGDRLLPHLETLTDPDGRIHLFAVRMTLAVTEQEQQRELVTAVQTEAGGQFGAWELLGNPHDSAPHARRKRGMGMPAAAVDGAGRIHAFVRNYATGLCSRVRETDGSWGPWLDLRGGNTMDGFVAVTGPLGGMELYATSKNGVVRWVQERQGSDYLWRNLGVPIAGSAPSLVRLPDARLQLLLRRPDSGWVLRYGQLPGHTDADGLVPWDAQPVRLTDDGGFGPVSAAVSPDGSLLAVAQRDERGGIAWGVFPVEGDSPLHWWRSDDRLIVHTPSVAFDAAGHPVVAALGTDGTLFALRADLTTGELHDLGLPAPTR